jgi:hypothetical protein
MMQNAWIISGRLAKSKAYCTAFPEVLEILANCIPNQSIKKSHLITESCKHCGGVARDCCHYSTKNRHYRRESAQ